MSKNDPESTHETRTRILEAAVKVFATKGYHDAKVDDIVGEAQTSKGAFYFYFPSKQDIFIALSDTFACHWPLDAHHPALGQRCDALVQMDP